MLLTRTHRVGLAAGITVAVVLAPPARAEPDAITACLDASEEGQVARDAGKLTGARDAFRRCARAGCPGVVRRDCEGWLRAVADALPSVVVDARDDDGDLTGAELFIDDRRVQDGLSGRAVDIDPGPHTLVVETADGRRRTQSVVVKEGERRRPVAFVFGDGASASDVGPTPFEVPLVSWILFGTGVAGGAVFATLATMAQSDYDALAGTDGCRPNCPADEVDAIEQTLIGANVSLGVGIAALGAGLGLMFALQPGGDDTAAATVALGPRGATLAIPF
ncbi:MAG: hypothetical protein AAGN82_22115 [Myxococcota bacterium]